MTTPRQLSYSRSYPVVLEEAFDRTIAVPLPELFRTRYGAIPPITQVKGQMGEWRDVGQTRTIVLKGPGGGSLLETLTSVDRPSSFGYELTEITGPMKPLVAMVEGLWSFAPAGTGTRITWEWTVHPATSTAARAMGGFARMWTGSARNAFDALEEHLVPS
jgi:hypothetical protein